MVKNYHRAFEDPEALLNSRNTAFKKGTPTGFHLLDQIASFVPCHTTVIYAPPHVGKSVITLDILVGIAEREGKKIAIYSPEFRRKEELFQSLIQTRLSTAMYGEKADTITDEEFLEAAKFVDEHFVVLSKPKRLKDDTQEKMTLRKIYGLVKEAQDDYGWKFDFLLIDPANFIDKSQKESTMQLQDYVLDLNDMMAEFSEALNLHTIVTAHTRDMELIRDTDTGITYYPYPHPSQIMNGQSWFRASYQIIAYWRAPAGVIDKETAMPYPENATEILVQKSKPFGCGKLGKIRIFFDPLRHRMYEEIDGQKYYVNDYYKKHPAKVEVKANSQKQTTNKKLVPQNDSGSALRPSTAFDTPAKQEVNIEEEMSNWI